MLTVTEPTKVENPPSEFMAMCWRDHGGRMRASVADSETYVGKFMEEMRDAPRCAVEFDFCNGDRIPLVVGELCRRVAAKRAER